MTRVFVRVGVALLLFVVVAFPLGVAIGLPVGDVVIDVLFGFVPYALGVARAVPLRAGALAQFAVLLVALVLATHLVVRRLAGRMSPPKRWRVIDTTAVLGLLLMLFVSGMAIGGVGHQVGWLSRAEQPLTKSSWATLRMEGQYVCRQTLSEIALEAPITGHDRYYTVPLDRTETSLTILIFPREPRQLSREGGLLCGKRDEFIAEDAVKAQLAALRR